MLLVGLVQLRHRDTDRATRRVSPKLLVLVSCLVVCGWGSVELLYQGVMVDQGDDDWPYTWFCNIKTVALYHEPTNQVGHTPAACLCIVLN